MGESDLEVSASRDYPHCYRNSHRDLLLLEKKKLKGLRGTGEGDSSGLPLGAGLVELGPAWEGAGKARCFLDGI